MTIKVWLVLEECYMTNSIESSMEVIDGFLNPIDCFKKVAKLQRNGLDEHYYKEIDIKE